jgi:fructokinase
MARSPKLTIPDKISGLHRQGIVVLIGEVLADIFPDRMVLGGAPFNVARHLQAFGLFPLLITRVGNDQLGSELLASMAQLGMTTQGVQRDPLHPTGQVIVHIEQGTHRFEIPADQAYDFIRPDEARLAIQTVTPELIYFGTLAQRNKVSRDTLASILQTVKIPCVLDINLREPWYTLLTVQHSLHSAAIVKMNDDELDVIAKSFHIVGNTYEQAVSMIKQFSLQQLLVTCGAKGAWLLNAEGEKFSLQGAGTEVVDTVGAGDGFAAVFILGLLRGWPNTLILSRANSFAAALCSIRGAVPAEIKFYDSFLEAWAE